MTRFLALTIVQINIFWLANSHVADPKMRHTVAGEHNPEFDHEQFLGKEMSHEFDELPLHDSLDRLGKLFDKIDVNHDGKLDTDEMTQWMRNLTKKYIIEDTERYWRDQGIAEGQKLTWDMYKTNFKDDDEESDAEIVGKILAKDEKRFAVADLDHDGLLDKQEMAAFLHPEEYEHTRPSVAHELLSEIDLDGDGFVNEEEYMKDMGFIENDPHQKEHRDSELKNFRERRDQDHDGKLNFEEFMDWLAPSPEKYAREEAVHLVSSADDDKDGFLSKSEMLAHHDVFAGSQLTDYGDVLRGRHDEL